MEEVARATRMANKSVSVPITTTGELVVEAISSAVCTKSVSASDFACLTWIPASSRIGVRTWIIRVLLLLFPRNLF